MIELTYIYFPASIETIEDGERYSNEYSWEYYGAFANTNLRTIELAPNSKLKYIGECTFAGAGYYELEVTLPASVETIADYAFCYNYRLASGNYERRRSSFDIYFETGSKLKSFGCTDGLPSLFIDAKTATMVERVGWLIAYEVSMTIGNRIPPRFDGVSSDEESSLYVPQGCVGAYYDADGWKWFDVIKEIGQE